MSDFLNTAANLLLGSLPETGAGGGRRSHPRDEGSMTLYPYQIEGAKFLAARRRALLADEQGLGKTAQAITAANMVGADPVLVVCPASVRSAWVRDIRLFATPGRRFVVESYDRVSRHHEKYQGPWGALVLDEAHYLKSMSARRTVMIYGNRHFPGLLSLSGHVWALTGTPAPNYPVEMFTHMRSLFPESLAMASDPSRRYDHERFMARYCILKDNGYGLRAVGSKNTDDLRQRLSPYVLRRLKKDVLPDLPDIRYEPLIFDAPDAVASLAEIPGEEIERVRKALDTGAHGLESLGVEMSTLRRLTAMAKAELVHQWVREFLGMTDRKLVVFGYHGAPLEYLRDKLGKYGRSKAGGVDRGNNAPPMIWGKTQSNHRANAIERFQTGTDPVDRVFLGQISAAGAGITLTAASDLLFLEQSWSPSDNAQAAMRIHRIGQKRGCLVRYATLAGSIDEAVQSVLARKTKDLSRLFD